MSATFRDLVREAFTNTLRKSEDPTTYAGILAVELRALLRANGYSIHRSGECVHPRVGQLGRPMTPEEQILLGSGTP